MAKRDIFGEMMEGVSAMKKHRGGQAHLAQLAKVEVSPLPWVDSKMLRDTGSSCAVREQYSPASCGSMRGRWRNGSRGGRNQILRQPLLCCWCGSILAAGAAG